MEGKKVLITGGADGIGFGLAQALLQSNAQVCILDVNKSKGEAREQELHKKYDKKQSKFIYCDVTDLDMFSNAVEEAIHFLGHIDIFINNAGIADERNFQKCISVNLTAAIHGTNLAMQHMDKQNGGSGGQIVNVSSMAEFVLESSVPVYCATKSGILHYTRALSLLPNLDSMGISFQNICPSCTDTAIITDRGEKVPRFEDFLKNAEKYGVMPIERVVGAFMELLTDNINGGVMMAIGEENGREESCDNRGAQGIGLAVTKELLRQGSKACILDVNATTGHDTQQKLRQEFGQDSTKFITCDVTNEARFSEAVKEAKQFLGFINVFVNNAGIVDENNIERCVGINLIAVIRGTNLAMQHMSKLNGGQGGQIINVASIAARVAVPYFPTYCGTKSGVLHYTSSWAKNPDAEEMGITFQSMCPVFTDTPLVQNFENKVFRYQQLKTYLDDVGYITVERVVEAFMRLLDDNINGGILEVKYDATTYTHEEDKKTSDDKLKI